MDFDLGILPCEVWEEIRQKIAGINVSLDRQEQEIGRRKVGVREWYFMPRELPAQSQ